MERVENITGNKENTCYIQGAHQTRFHSVPNILVKCTGTVFGRSGHKTNLSGSVYELNANRLRWVRTGTVLQNFEPAQNFLMSIPSYN